MASSSPGSLKQCYFKTVAIMIVLTTLAACGEGAVDAETYEAKGIYLGTAFGGEAIVVDHEEIPGYMDAMRMTLRIDDPSVVQELEVGDSIAFRLVVEEGTSFVDNVRRLSSDSPLEVTGTGESARPADSLSYREPGN